MTPEYIAVEYRTVAHYDRNPKQKYDKFIQPRTYPEYTVIEKKYNYMHQCNSQSLLLGALIVQYIIISKCTYIQGYNTSFTCVHNNYVYIA